MQKFSSFPFIALFLVLVVGWVWAPTSWAQNNPPTVDAGPDQTATVGQTVNVSGSFTDPDTADTHTCTIDWGDSNTTPGTVSESNGSGTCSGSHTYAPAVAATLTQLLERILSPSRSRTTMVESAPIPSRSR